MVWEILAGLLHHETVQALLAGCAGGLVRWIVVRESWRRGLPMVVVGGLCAIYLTPLTSSALEPVIGTIVVDPSSQTGFAGFIIGLGGVSAAAFFIDFWRTWRGIRGADPKPPPRRRDND